MLGPKAAILDDHDALEVTEAELVRDIGGQTRSIGAIPDVMRGRVKGLDANVQLHAGKSQHLGFGLYSYGLYSYGLDANVQLHSGKSQHLGFAARSAKCHSFTGRSYIAHDDI